MVDIDILSEELNNLRVESFEKYRVVKWNGVKATNKMTSKKIKKNCEVYPNDKDVNILYEINDNTIIKNTTTDEVHFIIETTELNQMDKNRDLAKNIINALNKFPKSLRQKNSRGIGLEFGYYSLAGPDNKDGANMRNKVCRPLLKKPTIHPRTLTFQNDILIPLVECMWYRMTTLFPIHSDFALSRTPIEFRYPKNTGFSKITVAHNNGTPYHYDRNNLHGAMTAILILCDGQVEGGEQIIESGGDAIIINTVNGLLIVGDYTYMRHAVFPILQGDRIAIIAYSMEKVYQYSKFLI